MEDKDGNQTANKAEDGAAMKAFIAVKGRGQLMQLAELVSRARRRRRNTWHGSLDPKAVVGVLDTRRRAAVVKEGKSHGPGNVASDLFKQLPQPKHKFMIVWRSKALFLPTSLWIGRAAMDACS